MISSEALRKIRAIVLDLDGVLTDGRIGYGGGSNVEIKYFHVRDGHGLKMAMRAGIRIGILTGRNSVTNDIRVQELKLDFCYQGVFDKKEGFLRLLREQLLKAEECMYIGDDVVDLPPMRMAGFSVAVADAVQELDEVAHYRTSHRGGSGAVREAVEILLKGQGLWEQAVQRYYA